MIKFKPIIFYVVFFLFVLAFGTITNNYDCDLWARLIAGMGFIQSGHVLKQDFLSYTPTHQWFDHEWGSGVIFYLIHHFFSSAGLMVLQAVLIFLTFFFISKIVKLRGCKSTTAYNFLFYYFTFISFSYIIYAPVRCQMFSFLFFTVFLYILELARVGKFKPMWLLPIIMIVWNNLHGGCVAGIGLIFLYVIGEFLNKKPVKPYVIALVLSVIVLPINPWGFAYLGFLFKAVSMQRPLITEWDNIFSDMVDCSKFKIYALVFMFTELIFVIKQFALKTFKIDYTKLLVILATLAGAILHVKFIPFAVITMASFLYDDFYNLFNSLTKNWFNKIADVKDFLIYSLILLFAFSTLKLRGFGPYLDWSRYPVRAVEFLKINNIEGNLLTDFTWGSYISYKLYPNNKIYMDGRYEEVYNDDMLPMYDDFYNGRKGWDKVLVKFPTDIILIEKTSPVCFFLNKDVRWKIIF